MSFKNFFARLWRDEEGQTTTEYILILAVVVMIAMKFKSTFSEQLEGIIGSISGNIEEATQFE